MRQEPASIVRHLVLRRRGPQPVRVEALPAGDSPTGQAHLLLRFGVLTVRCHDREALRSQVEAWLGVYGLAGETFRPPPARTLPELHRAALAEAGSRYPLIIRCANTRLRTSRARALIR